MDTKLITDAIDFAVNPNTRAAFITGLGLGVLFGFVSCKFLYMLSRLIASEIRTYFLRKDRLREEERQRKEAAAKRRLESCSRRKEAERLAAEKARKARETEQCQAEFAAMCDQFLKRKIELGVQKQDECTVTDRNGVQYCPDCFEKMRLVPVIPFRENVRICPKCGEEVPDADHWYPPPYL